MLTDHFNCLTPAQAERLAFLAEECAECIQAVSKILRHGYESANPHSTTGLNNRAELELEIGHIMAAIGMLSDAGDLSNARARRHAYDKRATVMHWMHHQVGGE